MQRLTLADESNAHSLSNHPLYMFRIERGLGYLRRDALGFQHFEEPLVCSRMVSRIAEDRQPVVQILRRQFIQMRQWIVFANTDD